MARVLLLGAERHRAGGLKSLLTSDRHDVLWSRSTSSWRAQEREMRPDVVVAAVASADGVLAAAKHAGRPFAAPLLFVQQEGEFLPESYLEERLVDRGLGG